MEDGLGSDQIANVDMSFCVIISNWAYFLYQSSTNHVYLYKNQLSEDNWTNLEDCGANQNLPDTKNMQGIAYDGSDILYFILKNTIDSKNYLYTYIISTDTLTEQLEHNIALMLDRNNSGVSPNDHEKAFHITNQEIYKITISKEYLFKLYDLVNADTVPVGVIEAVTDTYVITNDKKIYEWKDFL